MTRISNNEMAKRATEDLGPVKAFWAAAAQHPVDREGLRPTARDPHLQLAVESAIEKWLSGGRLLDVGCGDGLSTLRFAGRTGTVVGIDYIEDFVARAAANATRAGVTDALFEQGDVTDLSPILARHGKFDVVTSIRCLINLTSWDLQRHALSELANCLRPGGLLFISEGWLDGFSGLNIRRRRAGLPEIALATYNLMISRDLFETEVSEKFELVGYEPMGLYLFMSRVFMPRFVAPGQPSHDHPINRIASELQSLSIGQHDFSDCDYAGVYILRRRA
jgi:2-polyprenyl-3-methyl-5-hydroxy-6-metoxy-1,4-benzoquinol methylase